MFKDYKTITCGPCGKTFEGREPAEGGDCWCPECRAEKELPIVNEGDKVPKSVDKELEGGRGEDE